MSLSIKDRGQAIARARTALTRLEQHHSTSVDQLGQARCQLNATYNAADQAKVAAAVQEIERIVSTVYGTTPVDANH